MDLMEIYETLVGHFGHQRWWPGDTKLEICVGAILTQNTNWSNVEKAIKNLKDANVLDVDSLVSISPDNLAQLIKPAGYFNIKAGRLKNFITTVAEFGELEDFLGRDVDSLREDLLGIKGVGRETADSIMLYAAAKPSFVVDTYTVRVFARHGLIDECDCDYETVREFCQYSLPEDVGLYNDFHAQLVAVGKKFCRKSKPLCSQCPLNKFPLRLDY